MIRRNNRNFHNEYVSLKKEAKGKTPTAVRKREVWKGALQDVFDIASGKIAEENVPTEDFGLPGTAEGGQIDLFNGGCQ